MSSPVIVVKPDAPLREVARTLAERKISAVPVVEGERLVGIVSEADVLRRGVVGPVMRRARDIMTEKVTTVATDTPVEDVAALLAGRGIGRVPVVCDGRLVGIVSRANLVQAIAVKALPEAAHPEDDAALRSRLLALLQSEPWWRRAEANVVVDEGVVHYWGTVSSEGEREAARVVAMRIPGVRRVEDHRLTADGAGAQLPGRRRIRRASDRGHSRHGWVDSYHSFSFGDFYDPAFTGYGPLYAINEKLVQPAKGSTTYGLRDMEVIAYVLDGVLGHEDSLDNVVVLQSGAVQCMSAGSGVRFSETNVGEEANRYLQIWLEPDRVGLPARYAHRRFSADEKRGRLQLIASGDGRDGSLCTRLDALLYAGLFDGQERVELELARGRLGYVHIARGTVVVDGEALGPGDALAVAGGVTLVIERGDSAELLALDLPEAGVDSHGE